MKFGDGRAARKKDDGGEFVADDLATESSIGCVKPRIHEIGSSQDCRGATELDWAVAHHRRNLRVESPAARCRSLMFSQEEAEHCAEGRGGPPHRHPGLDPGPPREIHGGSATPKSVMLAVDERRMGEALGSSLLGDVVILVRSRRSRAEHARHSPQRRGSTADCEAREAAAACGSGTFTPDDAIFGAAFSNRRSKVWGRRLEESA